MYDCIIAGAGPAGSYTAQKLVEYGFKTLILEEHSQVGIPVHCTGIVGKNVIENFDIPGDCIIKQIDHVKVWFPSGESVQLPTPIKPYLIDRAVFDNLIFNRAVDNGAEYRNNCKVTGVEQSGNCVTVTCRTGNHEETLQARLCILAVGAMSSLPQSVGFKPCKSSCQSAQIEAEIDGIRGIELYLGENIAPGSFAYAASINGTKSKLGLITSRKAGECYKNLLKSDFLKGRIVRLHEAPKFRRMPLGIMNKTVIGRIMLVGDCASQLKSTTGGGVYYGMRSAGILADCIQEARKGSDFKISRLNKYHGKWKKEIYTELASGLILRRFLETSGDQWWDMIPEILKNSEVRDLISNYREFDHHYKFIFDFFRLPSAQKYLLKILKKNLLPAGFINFRQNKQETADANISGENVMSSFNLSC